MTAAGRGECRVTANGYQLSLWGEHVLTLIAMVAQLREYTRNHQIVQFTWVSYMVCELYLNKAVIFKS